MFADTEFDAIIHDKIALRLHEFAAVALEPVLRWLAVDPDEELFRDLCFVASELGVRDDRVFQHLCEVIDDDESAGAICFANFGDERAIPILRTHIEAFEPDWDSAFGLMDLTEMTTAYEDLAGAIPDDVAEKVRTLEAKWNIRRGKAPSNAPVKSGPKVGRNESCPCGSGKKHKRCCLE